MRVSRQTLPHLQVPVPSYRREDVTVGIVHFGVGGFHRAHQAMYVDRLLEQGLAQDWGICGVGVMPRDRRMQEALDEQDGLYTLVLTHPDGRWEPRVIGSIVDYRYAPDDPEAVVELLAAPTTRIVSLTIAVLLVPSFTSAIVLLLSLANIERWISPITEGFTPRANSPSRAASAPSCSGAAARISRYCSIALLSSPRRV